MRFVKKVYFSYVKLVARLNRGDYLMVCVNSSFSNTVFIDVLRISLSK